MGALWSRRTIRHLLLGLLPLAVVGAVLVGVLVARFAELVAPVRKATATASATVVRSGLGPDRREIELRWVDARGEQRLSRVRVPEVSNISTGVPVTLHYIPNDPGTVFLAEDATTVKLRDLAYGTTLIVLLVVVAAAVTGVRIVRRLAAERRPGATLPVTAGRSRRGLLQRSWLIVGDNGREWWVPVHWEPVLDPMLAKAPRTVHGRPSADRVITVEVAGTQVWQSGRKRVTPPRGELTTAQQAWSTTAERGSQQASPHRVADPLAADELDDGQARGGQTGRGEPGIVRQLLGDAAFLVIAPLLGLLWAYVSGGGRGSLVVSTLVFLGVMVWLPAILGSDPSAPRRAEPS